MNIRALVNKGGDLLRSRVLRNVILWAVLLFIAHGMNTENERAYHYGFLNSPWYWWVMLIGLVLQLLLVFVNNLVFIPRLLVQRRRIVYMLCLALHIGIISVIYTLGLKMAAAHLNVSDLQQVGMISSPVSTSWSLDALAEEAWNYFVGNAIWVFVFTMAWYMNDYARQRRAADKARQQQSETELAFLRSQLAPHFLFNTLNNIYALTLKESSAAPDAMLKLSAILRALLYESGKETVSFEKEADIIRAYADLELLRLKDTERFRFHISADHDYEIPSLLWLPVLENIFKHGTRIISEELFVDFSFVIKDGTLSILGRNYCKDMAATSKPEKGIGLKNLRRRLQLLYPDKHTFRAGCANHVFTTEVTVKLH